MSLETLIQTKTRYEDKLEKITFAKIKLLFPIIAIVAVVISGYFEQKSFMSDITTKESFICKSTLKGGITVVIDKQDGWIIKDNYFIKGQSKISIKRCTPLEEKQDEH